MTELYDKATPLSMLNRYPHRSLKEHEVRRPVNILTCACAALCCTTSHDITALAITRI